MGRYPVSTLAGDNPGYAYDNVWDGHEHVVTGSFTLAASATTTTVSNARIKADSEILLTPMDAEAAGVVGCKTNTPAGIYVSTIADGSFIVTHDNHADAADATFQYFIFNPKQVVTEPGTRR